MVETVSIIIPIYNVEKYLIRCINSVICQTYTDLQIILVDDGSTDGSEAICNMFANQDARVEVIHQANGGLSSARNAGLSVATGKYIYFLDSDDYIDSQLVEICVDTINRQMCDVVIFNYILESEDGVRISKSEFLPKIYQLYSEEKKMKFLVEIQSEYDNCGWNAWNRFYRAEIIKDNKLYFPDNREIFAEDLAYAMRICLYMEKMCIVSDTLYHYVVRHNSIMGTLQRNPIDKFVKMCIDFEKFAIERGFQKEFSKVKKLIFTKILYFELKKDCKSYLEIIKTIDGMNEYEKEKILDWFENTELRHIVYSHYKMRSLLMYCEICLVNHVVKGRNKYRILEYWVWYMLVNMKNGLNKVEQLLIKWCQMTLSFFFLMHRCIEFKTDKKLHNEKSPKAYLIGTEDFGNLGDHQIAVSEIEFIKKYFNKVIEVPASKYFSSDTQKMLIKEISMCDIIFMTGGGNFGNVYTMARDIRNDVMKKWSKNIKVVMPQTAYYTSDKIGKKALKEDRRLFSEKNQAIIVAREQDSYLFLRENFQCMILLTPDIVLYSSYNRTDTIRERKALICLRSDKESILDKNTKKAFSILIKKYFSRVESIDLQKDYSISVEQRDMALHDMFMKILSSSLVVTDRLHGMIFCAITGTPCIVLENYNHKIRSSYVWLEEMSYINLVSNIEEAERIIKTGFWKKQYLYDDSKFSSSYQVIMEYIKNIESANNG